MDPERFDIVVQTFLTRMSRRRGVAALLGGLLTAPLPGVLEAKQRRHAREKEKQRGNKQKKSPGKRRPDVSPPRGSDRLTGQIAGGTQVPEGKYPFAASIRVSLSGGRVGLCTGSLISPSHVLTAAHCTYDSTAGAFSPPSAYSVVVGQVNRTLTSCAACRKQVTAVRVDPAWVPSAFVVPHDVAVLVLDSPVAASIAQPIAFVGSGDASHEAAGQAAVAAGWGITTTGGSAPTLLMEAPLPVAACSGADPTQVCTGVINGRDPCSGDSGGPLFVVLPGAASAEQHQVQAAKKKNKKKHPCPPCKRRKNGKCKANLPDGTACANGVCQSGACVATPPPPPVPAPTNLIQIGVVNGGPAGCPSSGGNEVYARLSEASINSFVRTAMATT